MKCEQSPEEGTIYMVCVNDGSWFQNMIYATFDSRDDAEDCVARLKARNGSHRHIYMYESKQLIALHKER